MAKNAGFSGPSFKGGGNLSKDQAVQKLKHYCAYQDRCHKEVEEKLNDLGVRKSDHDEIIALLIEDDYLNEERFAVQFARGKFRINQWGRKKILYGLKEKQVSEFSIKKALRQIDTEQYEKTLHDLAKKKMTLLKNESDLVRRKKTCNYLLQKGFEPELVSAVVNLLNGKKPHS